MEKKTFELLSCSYPEITYRQGEKIVNPPINLATVTHVTKGKHAWYPDNIGLSTIEWHFAGAMVRWCYPFEWMDVPKTRYPGHTYRPGETESVSNPAKRDAEYDEIVKRFSVKEKQYAHDSN